ncbi:uncharacterized protein LOC117126816 [Brassica rapa]|uniref:uncharacterized protein LOC117126816 n=1 Tax=Brassica campestris TaxID=3711 RepID=UPI00142D6E9C|nr:uncharacterized protein LOC117126816 [Brassica rapa]
MSWNWRCILRLRDLISRFLIVEVHCSLNTSFWYDRWTPLGPLINVFGTNGTRNLRIHIDASVADAYDVQGWRLPHPRSDMEVALHAFLTSFPTPSLDRGPDTFSWLTNGKSSPVFSSSKTWEVLRPRAPIQAIAKHIWFTGATPKHAFHLWVTKLNRLPTRSRLASWGMQILTTCCICSTQQETRDHLMLSCSYAGVLWSEIKRRIIDPIPALSNWQDLMLWASSSTATAPSVLRVMVTQALTYTIWQQRNNMLHNQILLPPLVAFKGINRHIINSINVARKRRKFSSLMAMWLI